MFNWSKACVLITGGTGSFGRKCVEKLLAEKRPKRVIVFSRDEMKQHEMQQTFEEEASLRFFIGDVRDSERLWRALQGVDVVIHAAALKQVPACEYNPFEAIQTNVLGAKNVIEAAIDRKVKRVVVVSTDKAVNPTNLYGATKLCAEKLFIQGNYYSGSGATRFCCVRYGNVIGSRGSVMPLFMSQRTTGRITVTDSRMTRFWLALDQGVDLVFHAIETTRGGEVFVPKIPSIKIVDLAAAVAPGCTIEEIGIRQGEKLHEVLISEDEARNTVELDDAYVIMPNHSFWAGKEMEAYEPVPQSFRYSSESNTEWLNVVELRRMAKEWLSEDPRRIAMVKLSGAA